MKKRYLLLVGLIIAGCNQLVQAKTFTLKNTLTFTVYAAAYRGSATMTRKGGVFEIKPGHTVKMEQPGRKIGRDRMVFVSKKRTDLEGDLSSLNRGILPSFPIGSSDLSTRVKF